MAGSDAVAVVTEFNNPIYSLVAKPENKTTADLKGKLIGACGGDRLDHHINPQAPRHAWPAAR